MHLLAFISNPTMQIDFGLIASANLVLATAEHWDRVSRRWQKRRVVSDISLFIADEVHLLGSEGGPTLEVVVSRMRSVSKMLGKPMRFVGLGSSIADAKDVGDWMGVPSHAQFNFPPHARAVPLEIHIHSLDIPSFEARIQVLASVTCSPLCTSTSCMSAIFSCKQSQLVSN
jgi:pre-mRNA-splicing helicase BRR2